MDREIRELLDAQAGVISRRQLHQLGATPADLQRMVRRRDLTAVHRGVFVDHTGKLSWTQTAWAGVLALWPAALWGPTALHAHRDRRVRTLVTSSRDELLHVAVEHWRRPVAPTGIVVHRVRNLPPAGRVGVITALTGPGLSTPARIRRRLDARPRFTDRQWWQRVNTDRGVIYRDVDYGSLVVELDGHTFHNSAMDRTRDLSRDLETAVAGARTVRLSYGQVFDDPCGVATSIAAILGVPVRPCGPSCAARRASA